MGNVRWALLSRSAQRSLKRKGLNAVIGDLVPELRTKNDRSGRCTVNLSICTVLSDMIKVQQFRLQRSKFSEVNHLFQPRDFWLITYHLFLTEQWSCLHCVSLVETNWIIPSLTWKGEGHSLTRGQGSAKVKWGQIAYLSNDLEWLKASFDGTSISLALYIQKL